MTGMIKRAENPKKLLTLKEVSEIIDTSERTVRRRIRNGELPVIRDGRVIRVHPDDLDRYIAAHRLARPLVSVQDQ